MNKQCQQPQAHPDRCGCVREIAEHNAQAYAESIAALAAKDARIAELESENSHLRHGMTGDYDLDAWLEWCAKKDATPSEDGLEVPEVVAYVTTGFSGGSRTRRAFTVTKVDADQQHENWLPHYRKVTTDDLMTVAQHSRIVAAKDAEIAHLKLDLHHANMGCHEVEQLRAELRAQPARQVGGDEREQFEAAATAGGVYACNFERYTELTAAHENKVNGDIKRVEVGDYRSATLQDGWKLWQARAALAPAAVDVDIVETLIQAIDAEQKRLSNEDNYLMDSDDCIKVIRETVARLNRRAIPVELLKRVMREWDQGSYDTMKPVFDELRALLGKEGE